MHGTEPLITLEPGEQILLSVRRHLFVFYARIIFILILLIVPLFAAPFVIPFFGRIAPGMSENAFFWALYSLWLTIVWILFFLRWTDYYLDVWIITNQRVIDIEHRGVFNSEVSTFRLEHIEDVTVEVHGVIATFLKFGTVHIHTAGESPDFVIRDANRPFEIKNALMRAQGGVSMSVTTPPISQQQPRP